jgi:predicted enzyme related to lactoylglutathione lyase
MIDCMTTEEVAKKVVELTRKQAWHEAVESLEKTIKKLEQTGGKVCVPKMAIPKIGWLAYAEDPQGNVFGIIEPDTNAK